MDLLSIFLQTRHSLYTLEPFLALRDFYFLQQVSKCTKAWITKVRKNDWINKRVVANLLRLVNGNKEALDQILSLWRDVPKYCQLFLTGSALLWCLTPSKRWRPRDIDLILFQPDPAEFPFFIDEKLERQALSGDETHKKCGKPWLRFHQSHPGMDDEHYRALFFHRECYRRSHRTQWKRMQCALPILTEESKMNFGLDVILRVGDAKSDPWEHLCAFDFSFLQNSWTPTGHLRIFDMQALCHKRAIHRYPQPLHSQAEGYWQKRANKYQSRGYLIQGKEHRIDLLSQRKRKRGSTP